MLGWGNIPGVFGLWKVEVFSYKFGVVVILLISVIDEQIVDVMCT